MKRLAMLAALVLIGCGKSDPVTTPTPVPGAPPASQPATSTPPSTTSPPATQTATPAGAASTQSRYECEGGAVVQAEYVAETARIRWNGRTYTLRKAGDSKSFSGPTLAWTQKGNKYELTSSGRVVATECKN